MDDKPANEVNIMSLLNGGTDFGQRSVGSRVKVTLMRKGKTLEVDLYRSNGERFAAMSDMVSAINEHQQRLSQNATVSSGDVVSAFVGKSPIADSDVGVNLGSF